MVQGEGTTTAPTRSPRYCINRVNGSILLSSSNVREKLVSVHNSLAQTPASHHKPRFISCIQNEYAGKLHRFVILMDASHLLVMYLTTRKRTQINQSVCLVTVTMTMTCNTKQFGMKIQQIRTLTGYGQQFHYRRLQLHMKSVQYYE